MADPVNVIVDHIPLTNGASFFEYFNNRLYCTGGGVRRIDLPTKQVAEIVPPDVATGPITAVDFHRPFPVPPDVLGSGAPDGRVYVTAYVDAEGGVDDAQGVEITPPLFDQMTNQFRLCPQFPYNYSPFITAMVVSHSGRYLYYYDWKILMLVVVDLDAGPRTLGGYQLEHWTLGMVISPDDRFIYIAHPFDNVVSIVDTTAWPSAVRKVPVVNSPFGLALSRDGKRLFVAQGGDSGSGDPSDLGTGTLSVFDTATMQGVWLYTGQQSVGVAVNSTGTRAYVSNSTTSGTVSVVDVFSTPEVIDAITGFTNPSFMRLSDDDSRLYVLDWGASPGIAVAAV
jgi:hypothetical protein